MLTDFQLREIPEIHNALEAGFTLAQIKGPPEAVRDAEGQAIQAAQEKYGPDSPEANDAIDRGNARAEVYTMARAAYERARRHSLAGRDDDGS